MYADNAVKNLFSHGPVASFHGGWKLSSYLVRVKVYPLEAKIESRCHGKKRCQVCLNVTETDSFTSTSGAYLGFLEGRGLNFEMGANVQGTSYKYCTHRRKTQA